MRFYGFLSLLLLLIFSGCSLKPDMPKIETEFTYSLELSNVDKQWWKNFEDKKLNELIELTLKNNSSLQLARLKLEQSRELLNLENSNFFPSFSAKANAQRAQSSGETSPGAVQNIGNNFSISALLSYEVDLWGRVRNSSNVAKSNFKASKYDYESARLSLVSQMSLMYFQLIALEQKKQILLSTMQAYKDTMGFRKIQLNEGAISEVIYLQSVAEFEGARVQLSSVKNDIDLTKSAIALMSSANLDEILYKDFNVSLKLPKEPEIVEGISADILSKRADVASAYEKLKASNFNVGVARTAYLPELSLTGAFGYSSNDLEDLFKSNANLWNIGGGMLGTLLDFGKTSSRVNIANLEQNSSLINYELKVKTALSEVRNALNERENAKIKQEYITTFLKSQEKIYNLSSDMFDEGYTSHLELLDSQRNLLRARMQSIDSNLDVMNSIVKVYKAFGGGFEKDLEEENK